MKYLAITLIAILAAGCSSTWKPRAAQGDTDTPQGRQDMTYRSGI